MPAVSFRRLCLRTEVGKGLDLSNVPDPFGAIGAVGKDRAEVRELVACGSQIVIDFGEVWDPFSSFSGCKTFNIT